MPFRFIKALFRKDVATDLESLGDKLCIINRKDNELVCFLPEKGKGLKITFLEKNKALINIDGNIKLINFKNIQDLVDKIYLELDSYLPIDINQISLLNAVKELKNHRIKLLESSYHYSELPKSLNEFLEKLNQRGSNFFKNKVRLGC